MITYGVYNVDMLEKLLQMVHKMNTKSVCILGSNFSITESIFSGTQAFANPTDLASSGVCIFPYTR